MLNYVDGLYYVAVIGFAIYAFIVESVVLRYTENKIIAAIPYIICGIVFITGLVFRTGLVNEAPQYLLDVSSKPFLGFYILSMSAACLVGNVTATGIAKKIYA